MMRTLVITSPDSPPGESVLIRLLLDEGVDRIHLRKPDASEEALRRLIESLSAELYPRLSLHDRLPLAAEYGLGGVHLNRRWPEVPAGFGGVVSRSCHSLEEITAAHTEDYLSLSPIYPSISKANYSPTFTMEELEAASRAGIITDRIIALGGVRPEFLPELRAWGFGGAAFLGSIWSEPTPEAIRRQLREIRKYNI